MLCRQYPAVLLFSLFLLAYLVLLLLALAEEKVGGEPEGAGWGLGPGSVLLG